ncbi:MAG TPA: hypothetical protein VK666_18935 [Chryseolinea sp.]|nr:hypothetical protein [Chryseolinea sp.]
MKKYFLFVLLCIGTNGVIKAQDRITNDPDSASIITTDITHFWMAFDSLTSQRTSTDSLRIIKKILVDQASEGLSEYMNAAGCHEKEYLETIRRRKADYLAIRAKTEAIAGKKQLLLQYLNRFKQLYPAVRIPAICFTIGKFEVGGTQFEKTLYIGCEVDIINYVDVITQSIHELAHFQQKNQNPATNLDLAMIEGGAEFVCYQVTGKRTIPATWEYGVAHEAGLWNEFRPRLDSAINMKWFSDLPDKNKNRPGSLAYFIGFRICETYWKRHPYKKLALGIIIEMEDPDKLFRESSYYQ